MSEIAIRHPTALHSLWAVIQAFPTALLTSALVTDIAYVNTAQIQWSNFSAWLIAGGLFTGGLAMAAAAMAALVNWRRVHWRRAAWFAGLSIATWVAAFVNILVHSRDGWTSVMPLGLALSAVTAALALASAWVGHATPSIVRVTS